MNRSRALRQTCNRLAAPSFANNRRKDGPPAAFNPIGQQLAAYTLDNAAYFNNGYWIGTVNGEASIVYIGDPTAPSSELQPIFVAMSDQPERMGSPTRQKAARLPRIATFLPSHLVTPSTQPQYTTEDLKNLLRGISSSPCRENPEPGVSPRINQCFFLDSSATAQAFRKELANARTDVLTFIGHTSIGGRYEKLSKGIYFYYPLHGEWDTEYVQSIPVEDGNLMIKDSLPFDGAVADDYWRDRKLVPIEMDRDLALEVLKYDPNWWYVNSGVSVTYSQQLLVSDEKHAPTGRIEKLAPQARIVFIASCYIDPLFKKPGQVAPFLQMWDIHDPQTDGIAEMRPRAIVVPTGETVLLGNAGQFWNKVLRKLAIEHLTIQEAVNSVNSSDGALLGNWKVLGNKSLKFVGR